jgi:hypothetical protein
MCLNKFLPVGLKNQKIIMSEKINHSWRKITMGTDFLKYEPPSGYLKK